MDSQKNVAIIFVILVCYAIYLESQKKLVPVLKALTTTGNVYPDNSVTVNNSDTLITKLVKTAIIAIQNSNKQMGDILPFVIAIIVYIIITGFTDEKTTLALSAVLVLGSAFVNQKLLGPNHTFLDTLEGK